MKITLSSDNIKSFGGLNFILTEFDNLQLPALIAEHLGERPAQAQFSFSDAIKNMWSIIFAGGDCAEDIGANLREEFLQIENLKVCSPDTLLRLQKSLALDKEVHIGKSGSVNDISRHAALNALNLDMLLQLKTLIPEKNTILTLTISSSLARNMTPGRAIKWQRDISQGWQALVKKSFTLKTETVTAM